MAKAADAGRPSLLTPEVAEQIVAALSEGAALIRICERPGMPDRRTVQRWQTANPEFAAECARAREEAADVEADEIKELADEQPPADDKGRLDPAFVAWKRNQISARQWRASKLAPKKYGDKLDVEHSGGVTVEVMRFGKGQAPG